MSCRYDDFVVALNEGSDPAFERDALEWEMVVNVGSLLMDRIEPNVNVFRELGGGAAIVQVAKIYMSSSMQKGARFAVHLFVSNTGLSVVYISTRLAAGEHGFFANRDTKEWDPLCWPFDPNMSRNVNVQSLIALFVKRLVGWCRIVVGTIKSGSIYKESEIDHFDPKRNAFEGAVRYFTDRFFYL